MKKLVICCDGTWSSSESTFSTNVAKTALALQSIDESGILQIVHYQPGVGTSRHEKIRGGAFGLGLARDIKECYRFLVLNYEVGDEIYVFGFSRGAFTARSLCGMIRNCGILQKEKLSGERSSEDETVWRIEEAFELYRKTGRGETKQYSRQDSRWRPASGGHPRSEESRRFRATYSSHVCFNEDEAEWRRENGFLSAADNPHVLKITYLGVWDTVGSLGVPKHWLAAGLFNRNLRFHNADLSSSISSARHAVAIDESLRYYEPTLFGNLQSLRGESLQERGDPDAYDEQWFPGYHGSVGGSKKGTHLSGIAMKWIWEGAQRAGMGGLKFDRRPEVSKQPDVNEEFDLDFFSKVLRKIPYYSIPRAIFNETERAQESDLSDILAARLHESVIQRFAHPNNDYFPFALDDARLQLYNCLDQFNESLFRRNSDALQARPNSAPQ